MKIVVDKMPEEVRDCFFSKLIKKDRYSDEELYACTLRPYIEEAEGKPCCICKSVDKCDRLICKE